VDKKRMEEEQDLTQLRNQEKEGKIKNVLRKGS
jgi:hypothetical protein